MASAAERREDAGGDTDLAARARDGDEAARREIYGAHAPALVTRLWRLCGSRETARDLTQDAFVIAFDRLHEFEGRSALGTWLQGIAYNLLRDHRRLHRRRRGLWARFRGDALMAPPVFEGETEAQLLERLWSALQDLDEGKRDVFVMRTIEGASVDEVAAILGIAPATVSYRAKQAEAHVRARFDEEKGR